MQSAINNIQQPCVILLRISWVTKVQRFIFKSALNRKHLVIIIISA